MPVECRTSGAAAVAATAAIVRRRLGLCACDRFGLAAVAATAAIVRRNLITNAQATGLSRSRRDCGNREAVEELQSHTLPTRRSRRDCGNREAGATD